MIAASGRNDLNFLENDDQLEATLGNNDKNMPYKTCRTIHALYLGIRVTNKVRYCSIIGVRYCSVPYHWKNLTQTLKTLRNHQKRKSATKKWKTHTTRAQTQLHGNLIQINKSK